MDEWFVQYAEHVWIPCASVIGFFKSKLIRVGMSRSVAFITAPSTARAAAAPAVAVPAAAASALFAAPWTPILVPTLAPPSATRKTKLVMSSIALFSCQRKGKPHQGKSGRPRCKLTLLTFF